LGENWEKNKIKMGTIGPTNKKTPKTQKRGKTKNKRKKKETLESGGPDRSGN
jgi:hypothetical protein